MKNTTLSILRFVLLAQLILMVALSAKAQKVADDKTLSPYFFVKSENTEADQLPLKSTKASVNIAGVIADVTVTQRYANEGDSPLEAIYVFPTSTRAAIYGLEMKIGNRTITAEIQEKNKARKNYEAAKSEGKRASLLEQERPNVFQMNVANIQPGDVIEVILKYTELMIPEEGVYEFVYPTVVGPRYSETTTAEASKSNSGFVATPYQKENKLPNYTFGMEVYLSAGMPIQHMNCKTHEVSIAHETISTASLTLDASETQGGNRDFVFEYGLSGDAIESGLLLYEHNDEQFFLAMMQPPKRVTTNQIPPREYIFVVDVSGSMGGFPLNISKKLLRDLITGLRPSDRFNVMVFSGSTGLLSEQALHASAENIETAVNFIDSQRGGGGTRLLPALQQVLDMPRCDVDLSRSVVVVTDGYVSVEKETYDIIRNNLDQTNVYAFGIGSGVNRYIIDGMAHVGGGEPMVITTQKEAHAKAEKFRKYINRPVLTQVKTSFNGIEVYDMEPSTIPDVLAERPVIVFGKYKGTPKGNITISGYTGGASYSKTFKVANYKPSKRNAAIRSLWARERIKLLDDYNGVDSDPETTKEITNLGLKYNLMTAYTSFVAIDHEVVGDGQSVEKVKQPLPLPQGVSNAAVGFDAGTEGVVRKRKKSNVNPVVLSVESFTGKLPIDFETMLAKKVKRLKSCFATTERVDGFEVIISTNETGKVISVEVSAKGMSEALKAKLKAKILKWQFISWRLEGGRTIEFSVRT